MNNGKRLSVFFLAALCAFPVLADDWDFAMDEMTQDKDGGQLLASEVARLRAEKGARFEFLPPPEGAQLFLAKDFLQPKASNWKAEKDAFTSRGGQKENLSLRYKPSKKGIQYVWVYLLDWKREGKGKGEGE